MSSPFPMLEQVVERKPWWVLLTTVAIVIAIQIFSLDLDPLVFQDEVQIIDFGRAVLDPSSDWALSWNVSESVPVLPMAYLSATIQEIAYRLGQGSVLGPRVSAMFGAVLVTLCTFGWLRTRSAPNWLALLLSILFLLNPVFSFIYRQGRMDSYAIAACLAACWLVGLAGQQPETGRARLLCLFAAGLLTVTAPFLWVTSLVLFPLIALEHIQVASGQKSGQPLRVTFRNLARGLAPFIIGCVAGGILLALPVLMEWDLFWQGFQTTMAVQSRAAVIKNSIIDLFLVHGPGLSVLLLVSLFLYRDLGLILAFLLGAALIWQTMVYLPRMLYLVPYVLAMIAAAYSTMGASVRHDLYRHVLAGLLAVVVMIYATWILIIRPVMAYELWPMNDPGQIDAAMERYIGRGGHRVLMEAWQGYYAGRSLGWKIYRAGSPVSAPEYLEFVRSMDYAIVRERTTYAQLGRDQLIEAGFELHATVELARSYDREFSVGAVSVLLPERLYGDLVIYRNTVSASPRD